MERKHILLIGTGGTIASEMGDSGLVPELTSEQLLRYIPDISGICDVDCVQPFSLDSSDLQPKHWVLVARIIREHYGHYDGFVVSHGTDTMAYTAAALSYLIQGSPKPIVLTGAQTVSYTHLVAVCDAVEETAGIRPGIKWTNDLILNGRKLGGILTEMALEGETGQTEFLIIGAGVNVRQSEEDFPPDVAQVATSLAAQGYEASRPALAAALIRAFYRLGEDLGRDTTPWVEAYRRDCVTIGKDVRLLWTESQERARALDCLLYTSGGHVPPGLFRRRYPHHGPAWLRHVCRGHHLRPGAAPGSRRGGGQPV